MSNALEAAVDAIEEELGILEGMAWGYAEYLRSKVQKGCNELHEWEWAAANVSTVKVKIHLARAHWRQAAGREPTSDNYDLPINAGLKAARDDVFARFEALRAKLSAS